MPVVDSSDAAKLIVSARWLKRWAFVVFSIPLATLGVVSLLHLSQNAKVCAGLATGLFAFFTFARLRVPLPDIALEADFRAPLLVLRSFSDERLRTNEMMHFEDGTSGRFNYIHQAAMSLWDVARMILIQREAGTVTETYALVVESSDSDWLSDVTRAAENAWVILIFPSHTPGVIEEMKLLRDLDVLSKTVVFMPQSDSALARVLLFWQTATDYRARWTELREQLAKHDFRLPDYRDDGLLYIPDKSFGIASEIRVQRREDPWQAITRTFDPSSGSMMPSHCVPAERTRATGANPDRRTSDVSVN